VLLLPDLGLQHAHLQQLVQDAQQGGLRGALVPGAVQHEGARAFRELAAQLGRLVGAAASGGLAGAAAARSSLLVAAAVRGMARAFQPAQPHLSSDVTSITRNGQPGMDSWTWMRAWVASRVALMTSPFYVGCISMCQSACQVREPPAARALGRLTLPMALPHAPTGARILKMIGGGEFPRIRFTRASPCRGHRGCHQPAGRRPRDLCAQPHQHAHHLASAGHQPLECHLIARPLRRTLHRCRSGSWCSLNEDPLTRWASKLTLQCTMAER
jgi:hypothetical protein